MEIYVKKAVIRLSRDKKLLVADYFQRAIRIQPDMMEWQTSHILVLIDTFKHHQKTMETDI